MRGSKLLGAVVLGCLLVALTGGCAVRAQQLRMQPMNHDASVETENQTDKKFLLYPLEDLRGAEYSRSHPTSFIPGLNLFHSGDRYQYPEQSGLIRGSQGGGVTATVGSLPESFPHLLAGMMREMRFTSSATPIEQINTRVDLSTYDSVVTGKLKKTKTSFHKNIFPLGVLALIGIPFQFVSYKGEYEVSVFPAGNLDEALMTNSYKMKGTKAAGLYYGHSASFDLFIGGLEKSLQDVVQDISAVAH